MASKQELESIINNPLCDEQQRTSAQLLLEKMTGVDVGSDPTAELLASHIRSSPSATHRAAIFAQQRISWKGDPRGLRSFAVEREKLPAKRRVYGGVKGDVIGYGWDCDVEQFRKDYEAKEKL